MTVTTGGGTGPPMAGPPPSPKTGREKRSRSRCPTSGVWTRAALVLGADDLDSPADLGTEQLQRLVVHRLRRRDHLAQVEQGGDQRGRLGADALGQVGQGSAPRQADRLAVAARQGDAAHAGGRHGVELLTPLLLALAPTD